MPVCMKPRAPSQRSRIGKCTCTRRHTCLARYANVQREPLESQPTAIHRRAHACVPVPLSPYRCPRTALTATVPAGMPVTASDLASVDIVITTYAVLRHDLDFEAGGSTSKRSARHARKYPVLPTPLTRLTWWRVIVDEAQMVERASRAAEMAASLSMVNRWCVTGTPISRGLADVYGLLRFLQVLAPPSARPGPRSPCWLCALAV